jgi:CheY-like chemotaxis protein
MVLERHGYAIELAVDGLEGLERARTTSPDVILMDLAMPNMDGFEATRAIREELALTAVHIIAVTAFCDAVSSQRALTAGCNEILAKPISPDVLAARVEAAVQATRSRARDAS